MGWTNDKLNALFPIMPHSCLVLTWTGGDSRSVPHGHGFVSSVGPRWKRHSDPAWYKLATSAHSCGQTVHWEAGARLVNVINCVILLFWYQPWKDSSIFKPGPNIYIFWRVNNFYFWTWTSRSPQLAAATLLQWLQCNRLGQLRLPKLCPLCVFATRSLRSLL